jgi:hypothetical protein
MDTGFKLLEGLRLSFYELIAVLLPGFAFIALLRVYLPDLKLDALQGIPDWLMLFGGALLSGHILKGLADLCQKVWLLEKLFPPRQDYSEMYIFPKVKTRLAEIYALEEATIQNKDIWELSFSALEPLDLEKRDRLDANSDLLQSLVVIALLSAGAILIRWFFYGASWSTSVVFLLIHCVIIWALTIRARRLSKIADRLILWRFFARQCRIAEKITQS